MLARAIPYRPDVDGLRAVAVLAVLVFHLNPQWLRGGFVGVDVFFVISGFLISSITLRELELGTFTLRKFYGRRIRRLFPALLIVIPTVLVAGAWTMTGVEFARLGKHVASAATYLSNFTLWAESGYFDASSELKPLLHLWSLAVEEHFYFAWPLLVSILYARGANVRSWTAWLTAFSLISGLVTIAFYRTAAFYFSPLRFWEILFGGCLAMFSNTSIRPRQREAASIVGAACVMIATFAFRSGQVYPGSRALLPSLGAVLLILGGANAFVNRRVLSNPLLVWIGRISYPLYLWHWPVIVFMHLLAPGSRQSPAYALAAALVSIVLAELTFRLVERPATRALDPNTTAWRLIAPWCAIGAVGVVLWQTGGWASRYPDFDKQMAALDHDYQSEARDETCPGELSDGERIHFCRLSRAGEPSAAVFGDSHAGHLLAGLTANDSKRSWLTVGSGACIPALDLDFMVSTTFCRERSKRVLDYLVKQREIKSVVLSFFGEYGSLEAYAADHKLNGRGPETYVIGQAGRNEDLRYAEITDGVSRMIGALEAAGKNVVMAIDTPELPFFPRDCVARPFSWQDANPCTLERSTVDRRQAKMVESVAELRRRHPRLKSYDFREEICDARTCSARRGTDLIYQDSHHLTHYGATLTTKKLISLIDELE